MLDPTLPIINIKRSKGETLGRSVGWVSSNSSLCKCLLFRSTEISELDQDRLIPTSKVKNRVGTISWRKGQGSGYMTGCCIFSPSLFLDRWSSNFSSSPFCFAKPVFLSYIPEIWGAQLSSVIFFLYVYIAPLIVVFFWIRLTVFKKDVLNFLPS